MVPDRAQPSPGPSHRRSVLSSAAFYALAGPPVGGLCVLLFLAGAALTERGGAEQAVVMLAGFPIAAFFAYIFGAVPAAATGAVASWLDTRVDGWRAVASITCVGYAITTAIFAGAFLWTDGLERGPAGFGDALGSALFALPAVPATAFCAWRQVRARRVGAAEAASTM